MSKYEEKFRNLWLEIAPSLILARQFKFSENRKFRFDFAHLETKTAIEINGGIWIKSDHSCGHGLIRNYEKINLAITEGWSVFQLAPEMIKESNISFISDYIKNKLW
jgi:hypothetical protein